jgi:hypothetical protein
VAERPAAARPIRKLGLGGSAGLDPHVAAVHFLDYTV